MPTTISNPASFSSVRNAFNTHGYGISTSLFAYRQGGGIVPSSSGFNAIGAGTAGDPLRLSQFSGFTVPDLLRFTTPYTGVNASKFNIASRASSGNFGSVSAYFALRTNKSSDFGGTSVTVWNTNGATAGDTPALGQPYGWGPNSWASGDATNSGYEARVNVTSFSIGNPGDGSVLLWGSPGNYQTITGTGFTSFYPLSSAVLLDMTSPYEMYASGELFIRNIANTSISISTSWYLECNNNA